MSQSVLIACDAVAVLILVYGLYFPRYRRREMIVAILGVNVGVLSVATVLASSAVTAGLGLGLFAVLSIIRLRSQELDQEEVVYYFCALALGVLGGITVSPRWITPVLMGAVLFALYIGDHPRVFVRARSHAINLDRAYSDERELVARIEDQFGCDVKRLRVRRVDLVNDTTLVDVQYQLRSGPS